MLSFFSKSEAVRKAREEERIKAYNDRLALESRLIAICDKKISEIVKQKDEERASALEDKDAIIESLKEVINDKNKTFDRFRIDIENLEILMTEISAIGMGLENLTHGITNKFHNFKTRVNCIVHSVEKKERKYRDILERK